MRGPRPVAARLHDIVVFGERLARHLERVTKTAFLGDELLQDAAAKCVEAIGEAAGQIARLDPGLEARFPDLRLSDAYSARNRLSHGYHAIDYDLLWTTGVKSIPATVEAARKALAARELDGDAGQL